MRWENEGDIHCYTMKEGITTPWFRLGIWKMRGFENDSTGGNISIT
jgi:hypothetical protein